MTEDQKIRYRKLLSDQKQGLPADFKQFQKEVEKEKKTNNISPFGNPPIPMEKIDWQAYSPFSWISDKSFSIATTQDFSDDSYAKLTDYVLQQQGIPKEFITGDENASYSSIRTSYTEFLYKHNCLTKNEAREMLGLSTSDEKE